MVRGRADLVLAPDDDGPGAVALVRREGGDLFGFGAREAVVRAVRGQQLDQPPFGSPVPAQELVAALSTALDDLRSGPVGDATADLVVWHAPAAEQAARVAVVAFAHGWRVEATDVGLDLRIRPATP